MDIGRIARMVESDGIGELKNTLRVAQSDVAALLCEFMDVKNLDMSVEKEGDEYRVYIAVCARRIYEVGKTSESERY